MYDLPSEVARDYLIQENYPDNKPSYFDIYLQAIPEYSSNQIGFISIDESAGLPNDGDNEFAGIRITSIAIDKPKSYAYIKEAMAILETMKSFNGYYGIAADGEPISQLRDTHGRYWYIVNLTMTKDK